MLSVLASVSRPLVMTVCWRARPLGTPSYLIPRSGDGVALVLQCAFDRGRSMVRGVVHTLFTWGGEDARDASGFVRQSRPLVAQAKHLC